MAKAKKSPESVMPAPQAENQQSVQKPAKDNHIEAQPVDRQSQLATILIGLLIIGSGLLLYNYFQNASTPPTTKTVVDQTKPSASATVTPTVSATPTPTSTPKPTTIATPTPKVSATPTPQPTKAPTPSPTASPKASNYTVVAGDSLWTVAEKVYGNGFDWTKIQAANNLSNNAQGQPMIEVGQQLIVPNSAAIAQASPTPTPSSTTDKSKVAAKPATPAQTPDTAIKTYTVQHGDTLWSIAEATYGTGEKWTVIFNDEHNHLGQLPDGTPLIHAGNILYLPRGQ